MGGYSVNSINYENVIIANGIINNDTKRLPKTLFFLDSQGYTLNLIYSSQLASPGGDITSYTTKYPKNS